MTRGSRFQTPRYSDDSVHNHSYVTGSEESTASFTSDVPITPPAAYYSRQQAQADQLADFFGDSRKSRIRTIDGSPFYPEQNVQPPTYDASKAEPTTLARFMFVYGFVFPPFWLMGIVILVSELRPASDWETGKTEDEKTRLLAEMRTAEVKWAKRCIYALLVLITIIVTIVLAVILGKRRS